MIPTVSSTGIEVTTTNAIITIPRRTFRGAPTTGVFAFRLTEELPTSAANLPVQFKSDDYLQTLSVLGGTAVVGSQITTPGVYLIWFDKNGSTLQLLTFAP